MFPVSTQAPNRDLENARPPHCSCMAYLHWTPADWQRPHMGLCSSHFWRRALHLVQPVKDLDMGAGGWRGFVDGVEREIILRGMRDLRSVESRVANPRQRFWGVNKNRDLASIRRDEGVKKEENYKFKFDLWLLLSGITFHDLDPKCSKSLAANPREDPLISGALSVQFKPMLVLHVSLSQLQKIL